MDSKRLVMCFVLALVAPGCGPVVVLSDALDECGDESRCPADGTAESTDGTASADDSDGPPSTSLDGGSTGTTGPSVTSTEPESTSSSDSDPDSGSDSDSDDGLETGVGPNDDFDGSGDDASTGETPGDGDTVEFEMCPVVTAESVYCVTSIGSGLAIFGVDSGMVCDLGVQLGGTNVTSLGWIGDDVYGCVDGDGSGAGELTRINLASGVLDVSELLCRAAADLDGKILTLPPSGFPGTLEQYDSFADAMMGNSTSIDFSPSASRITASADTIYGAWHATDVLQRYSVSSEAELPDLMLQGYDGWVQGMSQVGDRFFIRTWQSNVLEFNATTGAQVQEIGLALGYGLACRPGTG